MRDAEAQHPDAPTVLPVRRVRFSYPDDFDPAWAPHLPEFAAAANGISLGMPYAEPLFIKAVRSVFDELDDDQRAAAETYIRQEVGHYTEHKRFNDLVTARYPSTARVQRWMARNARWVSRRSTPFKVAYAAGGETISYGVARWTEANVGRLMDGADPTAATLYLWHLAEEIEHKSSTYDVFLATNGSKWRYALAMATGFAALGVFTVVAALLQLGADRRLHRPMTWWRFGRLSVSLAFTLIPVMVVSALPGHHPSDFADPMYLPRWLGRYDPETGTMPLWGT